TDQWALACITYEMLAGRPPFIGDDTGALLYQVVHQDPPRLSNLVKDLPIEVERVIQRALAKEPSERFPNVTAFARAFEAAATGQALPPEPERDLGARSRAGGFRPVEVAPTIASGAEAYAPAAKRGRGLIWGGVTVVAAGGVLLFWLQTNR